MRAITIKTIWVTKFISVSDVTSTLSFSLGMKTKMMIRRAGIMMPAML